MYEALATKHKTNRSRSDRLEVFAGRGLISQQATRHDLIACTPMDYSTGFDLATEHHQAAVRRTIRQLLPLFLIAELHCTPWILMQDNTNYKDRPEELAERRALERPVVEEAMQWCRMQHQAGRYCLIENPQTSRLWDEESVQSMLQDTGGQTVTCQSGAYGAMNSKGNPIRKTFRFASNNKDILTFLQDKLSAEELKLCVPLEGKETTLSQEYPQRLITSILKGVRYVVRQRNPTRFNLKKVYPASVGPEAMARRDRPSQNSMRPQQTTSFLRPPVAYTRRFKSYCHGRSRGCRFACDHWYNDCHSMCLIHTEVMCSSLWEEKTFPSWRRT